ncbi:MAG: DUF2760 domain-containing protein [Gammaproteobacteria bacterium]|nr:DUF2760 domain-containing protein [Gammaproteobacteria bacterium]
MPIKDLKFDINLIPTTLDAFHIALLFLLLTLCLFLLVVMSIIVLRLMKKKPAQPAVTEAISQPVQADKPNKQPLKAAPEPEQVKPSPAKLTHAEPDAALQLLGLLQQEARFLDFIHEDVTQFSDADIGAAARVVHEGCTKVLKKHIQVEPLRKDNENSKVTLKQGFNASENRITGNIVGQPPFTGTLLHRGWRAAKVDMPRMAPGHDVSILAPAEIEL